MARASKIPAANTIRHIPPVTKRRFAQHIDDFYYQLPARLIPSLILNDRLSIMDKSGKRISSILSLGSSNSDKSSQSSMAPPSSHLSQSSRGSSPSRKPLPANAKAYSLKTSFSHQELQSQRNAHHLPHLGRTISPSLASGDEVFNSPQIMTPVPQPAGTPTGSIGSGGQVSRPGSPPKNLLRPMTPASETSRPSSRAGSLPVSRAESPSKHFSRPFTPTSDTSRPTSSLGLHGSNPDSPSKTATRPLTPTSDTKLKRKSWLPGKSRAGTQEGEVKMPKAWVITPQEKLSYDVSLLVNFQKVTELWQESADTIVFLHSRDLKTLGPSFRLNSATFASSRKLTALAYRGKESVQSSDRTLEDQVQGMSLRLSKPTTSLDGDLPGSRSFSDDLETLNNRSLNLYIPIPLQTELNNPKAQLTADDMEQLITLRNVFAFLSGENLVATVRTPSIYSVFLRIADFLQRYEFSNFDGSTLGEQAAVSFAKYLKDFKLADVRASREKTIEAIILGERLRSIELYHEGFVHAAGKYSEIMKMKSPLYFLVTDVTAKRLERADLDINLRLKTVRTRLQNFEFPSLFAGIANSTSSSESKTINFKAWKSSFLAMRRHVMMFYKQQFGAWPPSAKSKKNTFEESGLNRILLQDLYQDFSDLYDALVDRASFTTRSNALAIENDNGEDEVNALTKLALRRVMDEYDRSSPPVQPPVPLDTPLLPSLISIRRDCGSWDARKKRKEYAKRLEDDEINEVLMQSYNRDSIKSTPFLQAFMEFERRTARGKTIGEMADLRSGQWLFLYVVIQALPLVVVDAPGLQWTKGVEYFLCEVPKGSAPWSHENQNRAWYSVADGSGVVSLPADIIDHGVDGIYRRSHCWQMADKWTAANELASIPNNDNEVAFTDELMLPPPPPIDPDTASPRSSSPSRRDQRQSIQFGLEALPLPPGVVPTDAKPAARHNPSLSFDDILGAANAQKVKKKK
ncbi:MAG: hypothetical protein Q9167_003848 [Letrouitia subvulpina]